MYGPRLYSIRFQEFGEPYELMADPEGILNELAENTGEGNKQKLLDIARTHYSSMINNSLGDMVTLSDDTDDIKDVKIIYYLLENY